jgi:hypothetical protein
MSTRINGGIVTKQDVTRTAIAMEWLHKHVSIEINTRNNRRAVFSVQSMLRGYKKDKEDGLSKLSFETPACQDVGSGAEELRHQSCWVQFSWVEW